METMDYESVSMDVGMRLRVMREERGVSMRELARRSGLSANALSMIERALTSPSVSTLRKIATALEVPITAFFRTEPERQAVVFRKSDARTKIPFPLGLMEGLGGEVYTGRMEALCFTLEPGCSSGPHGLIHSGNEFVFGLKGRVEYRVEDQTFYLEHGDSLIFPGNRLHHWRNPNQDTAMIVVVIAGFEDTERPSEYHVAALSKDTPS
jgi:transcriptional regulator with XRE-family HTH domain